MATNQDGLQPGQTVDFETVKRIENERRITEREPKTSRAKKPGVSSVPEAKEKKKAQR